MENQGSHIFYKVIATLPLLLFITAMVLNPIPFIEKTDASEFWHDIVFKKHPYSNGQYYIIISHPNGNTYIQWACGTDASDDYCLSEDHYDECRVWKSSENPDKNPPNPIRHWDPGHDRKTLSLFSAQFSGDDWTCWHVKLDSRDYDRNETDENNNLKQDNKMVSQIIMEGGWKEFFLGVSNPSQTELCFETEVVVPDGWDYNYDDGGILYVEEGEIEWFRLEIYMPQSAEVCDIIINNPCINTGYEGFGQMTTISFIP